jgi:hypothetical protein
MDLFITVFLVVFALAFLVIRAFRSRLARELLVACAAALIAVALLFGWFALHDARNRETHQEPPRGPALHRVVL